MKLEATDPPRRAEVLRADARKRITRLFFKGRTIIRKEPLGPGAEARLAHEKAVLERLRGVEGVAQVLDAPQYPGSIVLEDAGGQSLERLAKPFDAPAVVALATRLSQAVAAMHARGVIHRDIYPGNVVCSRDGAPCLVDFSGATTFAESRPEFAHYSEIVGTLPYVAPEQTGRTGRSVDHRADLYALGATLYEVATGSPPFGVGEPLGLIHDHLARVPAPPAELNPAVSPLVSEIVMHLLEKEPDKRYQTADGVIHDLTAAGEAAEVGKHDVPLRLLPPSRLLGRERDVDGLREAFHAARDGRCRGLLVSGAPGVGKTALLDQLRSVVAETDGWFVTGKFDQYRRDLEFDAGYQAFRALGRLLLAEPEGRLDALRRRMLETIGFNAGLLTAVLPEFATLLGVMPDPGDPLTAQARAQRAAADALRAVAAPERPVVLVMDDLQWAGRTPLGFVDLVLSERPIEGLLIVGAYREGEVDSAHPLAAPLSRWSEQASVRKLRLGNLPVPALAALVAEILRVDVATAERLAAVIEAHTSGNPYETIELLNALRRDGLLMVTPEGWRWDESAVREHLGHSEVAALLGARLAAMPPASRRLVESMACLGGRVVLRVLEAGSGLSATAADDALAPALEEGLLVMDPGTQPAVRFRHDRIRDAVLSALGAQKREALQLELARRLGGVRELFAVAAEQYMPVLGAVEDASERRQVVDLLKRAAEQATIIGDHALISRLMAAALQLVGADETDLLVDVHTARHAALVSLGMFDEADEDYRAIEAVRRAAPERPVATPLQVRSLTHRGRLAEANALAIQALRECGIDVPNFTALPAELDRQLETLIRWLDETGPSDDLAKPDVTDPRLLTVGRLLDAMLAPTFFSDDLRMYTWVSLKALEIWAEHGPAPTLTGTAANAAFQFVAERGDYAPTYRAALRILRLGEARGYEPGTSHARNVFSLVSCWFEPFENAVTQSRQALEGLIAGGDLANAGYTLHGLVGGLLNCASSLDELITTVEEGLAFEQRTGGEQAGLWLNEYQWLVGVLRGAMPRAAGEGAPVDRHAGNPLALNHLYVARAVAAAIFADAEGLERHTKPLPSLAPTVVGWSTSALAYPLRGLALAWQLRESPGDPELLRELDAVLPWLVARAADAPDNFLHWLHFVEAELAWTKGDFHAAAVNFDTALREVAGRQRPWHQALISERAGRFFLAHGLTRIGHDHLAQARKSYLAWGATAKADQLDWSHPALEATSDPSTVNAGTVDLVGILSASQALSSQTSLEHLHRRVVEVVSAMTGATGVRLVPWSDERDDWLMPSGGPTPASVLRYVKRTGELLVVRDAVSDQRFARDPYFAGLDLCSLVGVPVFSRGTLRAVLLLENRLIRGAFSADRLDPISLIVGQLAVSLDNAQLYTRFRRIADEQAALRRVATLVAEGPSPNAVFDGVATETQQLLHADGVTLGRYEPGDAITVMAHRGFEGWQLPIGQRFPHDGESVTAKVRRTGRPARMEYHDPPETGFTRLIQELGVRASIGAPIIVEGRLWGIAVVYWTGQENPPTDSLERIDQFAKLLETAIANADSREQLVASRARLLAAGDEARRQVVRDLHDGAQQHLVQTIMTLRAARQGQEDRGDDADAVLAAALDAAERGLDELRELAHGILPSVLTHGGLRPAVRAMTSRIDVPVDVDVSLRRLPPDLEASAYFIVAEALTNVIKHAHASHAAVRATVEDSVVLLEVRDDGVGGVDPSGHGLVGIADRVDALGGHLLIESPPGAGTVLVARLPLPAATGGH